MPDPVTILATLAYAIAANAGTSAVANALTQWFQDAAKESFRGDLKKLGTAFLTITRPATAQELERAAARSSLHANLFCLMEALGETLERATGTLAKWRQCLEERLPQSLRDLRRPSQGFLSDVGRRQLLQAKKDCEDQLNQIEISFAPVDIQHNRMLAPLDDGYALQCATHALVAIEESYGRLPDYARQIFFEKWFPFLCGSFQHEIQQNQPAANILSNIALARLDQKIDRRFDETQQLIRDTFRPAPTPLQPFATVPPLPTSFIERPELSEPLVERLLSGQENVALTAAIAGMGGVGKTIVALGVCHHPRVRQAFPDGIVWLTVGIQSTIALEDRVRQIAQALNHDFRVYTQATYQTLLQEKAVLVVLDDVWEIGDVEPFLPAAGRSRLLYTSRDKTLAGPLGADNHDVGVLDDAQARRFLSRWSGRESKPPPEPQTTAILKECKGLALGLAMIGAALKGQPDSEWAQLFADLQQAQLKDVGVRPGGYAHDTLHASIGVSVNALNTTAKTRYLRLAVLLEDMPAPEALLQCLWGGERRDVRRTMRLFVDRSLASRDAEGNIRLHDLQLDYVRGEHQYPEDLALLHSALLLSSHILRPHPEQFASQMIGRLLAHAASPGITTFLDQLDSCAPRPRLRPLRPALVAAGGPAQRVLAGHSGSVLAVALTADGKRAVSGSEDHTLRVWDLDGNQPPRALEGHTDDIFAVALTADGKRAVSGARDSTLRVWDLDGNQPPRVLEDHPSWVTAVALTADGKRAVSGSDDGTLRVWDLEGAQPSRVLQGHSSGITAVALTADGKRAVSGSYDGTLRVWDLEGNQPPRVLEGHTRAVLAVTMTANGERAVSGSDDGTIRVWALDGNQPPRILEGHSDSVTAVTLTADGKHAVSGSRDRTLRVWDLDGTQPPRVLEGHTRAVLAVALAADGQRAVSGSFDHTLRVWDPEGNQQPRVLDGPPSVLTAAALTADGNRAVSGSNDGMLRVWDLNGNLPPRILEGHTSRVTDLALTSDGNRAVSGSDDGTIRVWDLNGNLPPRVLVGHTRPVLAVALTADGQRAISGSLDQTLRIWDLEGGKPPRVLGGYTGRVIAVALTAHGQRAISGNSDGSLGVWDLDGNHPPRVLEGHANEILAVALSADGERAVSGSQDRTLRVWDFEGNHPPRVLEGHTGWVSVVAITADGQRAISGSSDHTLRVWDLAGNQPPRVLHGHTDRVWVVALSVDGKHAVSGSQDHTLRVWDLERGTCLALFTCDAGVLSCDWAGGTIAAADHGGHIHLFAWDN